ncbi:hypothetical protein A0H81_09014, partial [Grifola frondosa]
MTESIPTTFKLEKTLSRHTRSLNSLAISPDGSVLLSGGDDALVVIWNLTTYEKMQEVKCLFNGPVSIVHWMGTENCGGMSFIFGCADGSLHIYQRVDLNVRTFVWSHYISLMKLFKAAFKFKSIVVAHDSTVEDISYDPVHNRVATVGGGIPGVWKLSHSGGPRSQYITTNICFCDKGASIAIFYLESHEIIEPWALKWAKEIPTRIGHAILSEDETSLIVSNLLDGLDHYSFPSLERVQTFPYPISQNYPMQVVTTGSRSRWIVSGGDDGFARVYDRRNGHLIASLTHGPRSSGLGSTDIKVWSTPPADRNDAIVHEKSATELHRRHIVFIVIATATAHQPRLRARGDVQEADSSNDSPTVFPPSKITNICNAFSRLTLREDTAAPSSATFRPVPKSTTCRYRFTQSIIVLIIGLILFQEIITTCDVRLLMSIPTATLNSTTIMVSFEPLGENPSAKCVTRTP